MARKIALVGALGGAFLFASPAAAATWVVYAGPPGPPPKGVPRTADQHRFFPATLHVHRGDTVRFVARRGFHTATFLGAHPRRHFPLMKADPSGATYSGHLDETGAPFWFNGRRKHVYNTAVLHPRGTRVVADRKYHNSGILRGTGYAFRFTKVGTFRVVCLVHPGMVGTIVVHARGAKIPSRTAVRRQAARQVANGWRLARRLALVEPDAGQIYAGVGGRVTVNSFFPRRMTVRLNDIVSFVNMAPSELHNVALGPADWIDAFHAQTDVLPFPTAARGNQVGPFFGFGSDRTAGGAYHHMRGMHGNGVLVTPLIDGIRGGLPNRSRIMFMAEGEFRYYCLYHGPSMSATITVVR